ncbi:MAG TPA: amino acid adenylation domain-containing protein [Thermoanaerobaculia bacterium]|nr:amino acid adenylation domain-containing protein [Thermoanaerobaculia bacterium]
MDNTQIFVLDRHLRLAPLGAAGELCIGGRGLARGYLHRPDLTAERFVPNPWSKTPGARLYRSGDLARLRANGEIEHLGRIDQQVKVRGLRIELGEIETLLAALPGIREAAVTVQGESARQRLVAYVAGPEPGTDTGELRRGLEQSLPAFMVPAAFVIVSALPRTATGKVDRGALPEPERILLEIVDDAPRSAVEMLLARIWAGVLNLDRVGVYDNFFELGGDSILSIQVVARAAREGCRITPRQIFEHQTIAGLAAVAESVEEGPAVQETVAGPVPLSPIQQRYLLSRPVDSHHFTQSALLSVQQDVTPGMAEQAFVALLRHHDALRLRFAEGEGGWRQWCLSPEEAMPAPWSRLDLSALDPVRCRSTFERAAADVQASLDLEHGPLARGVWFDLAEGQSRLLLVVHHLAVDVVSWRVLFEDLESSCRLLSRGEAAELPARTISFKSWSEKLSEHARAMPLEPELSWWLRQGEGAADGLPPVDQPGGADTEASTFWLPITFSAEETRALLNEVPKAYRTQINDVLLTALVQALGGPGGSLRVALEGHGREEILEGVDLSRTVGWFTTVFPVLLSLDPIAPQDPGRALRAVKEQLRAIPNRGIGYGLLRYLRGDQTVTALLERMPHPQVSFNYQGQLDQILAEDSLFKRTGEARGPQRSLRAARTYLLEVGGAVALGQLRVQFSYSGNLYHRSTIERLAGQFASRLRSLIAHCRSVIEREAGYTPSDFPLARLGQGTLDRILGTEWGIEDLYPLSPLQEGLIFHSLYAPGSGVYVSQLLCRLVGPVDELAFEEACRRVVMNHSILRTSFLWQDLDRPLQVVHGRVAVAVRSEDWRHLPPQERESRLAELLRADREAGFDLSQAPLMRWALIRTGEQEHQFLWSHHHILMDGWSFSAVAGEFLACYEALRSGREPELARHPPYRNYIAWIEQQDLADAEQYWRRALEGFVEPTSLASIRRPDSSGPRGSIGHGARLSPAVTAALSAQARRHRLTLNTLTQGAWGVLLGRYSGQDDVVFGVTGSGRPPDLPGVDSMVGFFINTLPVRLEVSGQTPVLAWLEDLQRRQVEQRQYEHSALVQVQSWSEVPHGRDLFESILVFENYPREAAMQREGLSLGVAQVRSFEQTNYPLTVSAAPGEQMALSIDAERTHFDEIVVQRLFEHLRNLVEGLAFPADEASWRLSDLPLLSEAERHQLLRDWNDTESGATPSQPVHQLFERQAERTPDAVALVAGAEPCSYRDLDQQANRLAHHLRRLGVGPEVAVGLCVERSQTAVVGLLAILKAGGAYVPMDPAYPRERLTFLIEDSGVEVVLAQGAMAQALGPVARIIDLEEAWEGIGRESAEAVPSGVTRQSLAYVIYTSGSTGRPKGVMVSQGNLAGVLAASQEEFGWNGTDVMACVAPFSFDIYLFELLSTLLVGGRCHLLGIAPSIDLEEWVSLLPSLTRVHAVPALMRQLVEAARRRGVRGAGVRTLFVGGDTVGLDLLSEMREVFPAAEIRVLYGPTEGTIIASSFGVAPGRRPEKTAIGRPLPGIGLALSNREGEPVPAGVTGEISIGGRGIARGYRGRPDLTAERFVPCSWSAVPGERRYRTGDLGRWLPDGTLEFAGRLDGQVKVRGFRIELGEVEAALAAEEGVKESVVVARPGADGERRLVAYVVPSAEGLAAEGLRWGLERRLPAYMVPATFVMLESLPLTRHGKVDRRSLPDPQEGGEKWEGARTAVEELLAGIFAEVLHRQQIGVEDSFFELGGHSLLATQVVSRIRQVFGVDLPLRALFEQPTVAGLSAEVSGALAGPEVAPPIEPAGREGVLPLSFAQERLWFLDQLEPGSRRYNIPLALGLRGSLSWPVLAASLSAVVSRHESLRTTFAAADGRPAQQIAPARALELPVADLRGLTAERRQEEARRLVQESATLPFDLARGPLLRATLLHLEQDSHVGLLTFHHIVADGWSMNVLVKELSGIYEALCQGRAPSLPALPVQYADFAIWQRDWLSGDVLAAQLAYWREQLGQAPASLDLPLDRPRLASPPVRGANVPVSLSEELSGRLHTLGRAHGVTLFMVLLASLQALLSRLTGQEDLVVGAPVANRNRREIEGLIGFFVNTLALRGRPEATALLSDWLASVRETALGAYAHQDLPFERLVEELNPERSLVQSPLFQVMFVLQNASQGKLELPGLRLELLPAEPGVSKFDLTLFLVDTPQGLVGSWEYDPRLFDAVTVTRLADRFVRLLSGAVTRPESRLADLPVLGEEERHQLLVDWNGTPEQPPQICFHELFEEQVDRAPEATALVFEEVEWSYRELDRRANRIAHHLWRLGVRPGSRVGLAMERAPEMIAALLAVLKTGAAYVPLDPSYPADRLRFLLEDSAIPVLLSQERVAARLSASAASVVCVDAGSILELESDSRLAVRVPAETPAYVIYTSGSTGRPKGVLISQRSLANVAVALGRFFGVGSQSRVLQFASLSFDGSAAEIAMAFGAGAALVLARRESLLPGPDLLEVLRRQAVSMVVLPPSTLAALPPESAATLPHLEGLAVAGEVCSVELARRWSAGRRFFNGYGPTEVTVSATLARYEGEGRMSLGRPSAGQRIYLVDRVGNLAPVGSPAEICVEGLGLAHGYLGQPDLTARRFVPSPFAGAPGERLYRTGDLARYRPDGELEFVGRIDEQVKVRGFRVEPGEIESALAECSGVREVAVVAPVEPSGVHTLVAYVVPAEGPAPSAAELRSSLKGRLPDFMIPAHLQFVDRLPLTPNAKIDRKALAARGTPDSDAGAEPTEPRTPEEEILAGIFAEVLHRSRVGVDDDFFGLGGHSLLATQVISRVEAAFGVKVPLTAIFETPTVAGLAARVMELLQAEGAGRLPSIIRVPRDQHLPLSYAQQRLWFLAHLYPDSYAYNLPIAIRFEGMLDAPALDAALGEVVRRHEVLRTTFPSAGGQPMQKIAPAQPVRMSCVDLSALDDPFRQSEIDRLIRQEAVRPFDLEREPQLRTTRLHVDSEWNVLLLTLHHIASDGWSMSVLLREMVDLYRALVEDRPSVLSEPVVQYADYAHWQQSWLQTEAMEGLLGYWTSQLAEAPLRLDLPFARLRPAVPRFRGASRSRLLPDSLQRDLVAMSHRESVTLFMLLLAGFKVVLHAATGETDLVVGTDIAHRNRSELEGLIGFFINQLALRDDLSGDPEFRELLARVRETALAAYAHQDLPFDRLVDALKVPRNLQYSPIFQVKLNMQNTPLAGVAPLPRLALHPVSSGTTTSQLDLNLRMGQTPAGLGLNMEYDVDLFDAAAIDRLLEQFEKVLQRVAEQPEIRLQELVATLQAADKERQAERERELESKDLHGLKALKRSRAAGRKGQS